MTRGWIFAVVVLATAMVNTVTCADEVQAKGSLVSGTLEPIPSGLETKSTVPSATVAVGNVTTAAPSTNTTDENTDEKPITETIRTYIEDSVKSVKHAISKIGKFVGELFEDTPNNSTASPGNGSHSTTVVPPATVILSNATTATPITVKEQK